MTATTPSVSAAATLHHLQDPQFVASLSEDQMAAMRASAQACVTRRNLVFRTLLWLLTAAGLVGFASALPVFGLKTAALPGTLFTLIAISAGAALFDLFTDADEKCHALLRPLYADECLQALELVQSFAACEQYRERVLAHPRQFVAADMAILRELAAQERKAGAATAHRAACARLHHLDQPTP